MSVLYVDTEHDRVRNDPKAGSSHRAKLAETTARIGRAAGAPCEPLHFAEVSLARIERAAPAAMVIGGSTAAWDEYDFGEFGGLLEVIRAAPVPILGICAGHQLIGVAHCAAWGPLGALREDEIDADPRFAPGQRKERGFLPVQLDLRCPLFRGLAPTAAFFQSHYWHLEEAPRGFVACARSAWSPIQAIQRLDRPVFGVQFHPERDDAVHANGAFVLGNFFALARDHAAGERTDR